MNINLTKIEAMLNNVNLEKEIAELEEKAQDLLLQGREYAKSKGTDFADLSIESGNSRENKLKKELNKNIILKALAETYGENFDYFYASDSICFTDGKQSFKLKISTPMYYDMRVCGDYQKRSYYTDDFNIAKEFFEIISEIKNIKSQINRYKAIKTKQNQIYQTLKLLEDLQATLISDLNEE